MGAHDLNLAAEATGRFHDAVGAQALAVSFSAEVEAVEADGLTLRVRTGSQRFSAQPAFSCLVEPAPGDRVACWRAALPEGGDAVHIVAVLARPDAAAVQRLKLAPKAEVVAQDFTLRTDSASFVYRSLQTIGELCRATIGQLRIAGASLSTVFDQQTHHARQHQRTVEGIDAVKAQVIDQQASELLHLQAETMLANGERVVKVRGAQIHFG
ncbi:DUF3540 domain-containing protein [Aquincola sp. S2]|uniref:DUF3540 domain-containing protein n=1 Tax=Pseudaquabacterium terrae TaxID=2732868 RepID=A0ABX2EBG2_9BURK|nr:DUF3540 domain-containing protein [Aquabacterium terrae]NRF66454.1 DUF3540 domain-containing protein [Aquabacterium terrae]